MEEKKLDIYMIIGIVCNILLVAVFVYLYFNSIPNEADLAASINTNIQNLSIYNEKLDQTLSTLKKVENLPININPNEIGKQNPYNF